MTATLMASDFLRHANQDVLSSDLEWTLSEIHEELYDLLSGTYFNDGVDLAKTLMRKYRYELCEEFLDLCNTLYRTLLLTERHAVREWVSAFGIAPKLPLGARVRVPRYRSAILSSKLVEGEIIQIDMEQGLYTVFVAELGHVRRGSGVHGLIVPWEVAEKENELGRLSRT